MVALLGTTIRPTNLAVISNPPTTAPAILSNGSEGLGSDLAFMTSGGHNMVSTVGNAVAQATQAAAGPLGGLRPRAHEVTAPGPTGGVNVARTAVVKTADRGRGLFARFRNRVVTTPIIASPGTF